MYAYISGKLVEKNPTFVVIDVQGIGYQIHISLHTYSKIGDTKVLKLFTYFHVREDQQTLFGFYTPQEKLIFTQLIAVSGIGVTTGIMMLSSMTPAELFASIRDENVNALKRIKGIGAKTAARIVLELKDKIKFDGEVTASPTKENVSQKREEAIAALMQLGMNKAQMTKRVDRILKEKGSSISVAEIIKWALRNN